MRPLSSQMCFLCGFTKRPWGCVCVCRHVTIVTHGPSTQSSVSSHDSDRWLLVFPLNMVARATGFDDLRHLPRCHLWVTVTSVTPRHVRPVS